MSLMESGGVVAPKQYLPVLLSVMGGSPSPFIFSGFPRMAPHVKQVEAATGSLALVVQLGDAAAPAEAALRTFCMRTGMTLLDVSSSPADSEKVLAAMADAGMVFTRQSPTPSGPLSPARSAASSPGRPSTAARSVAAPSPAASAGRPASAARHRPGSAAGSCASGAELQARRRRLEERAEALRSERVGLVPAPPPMRAPPAGSSKGGASGRAAAGKRPAPPVAWGSGELRPSPGGRNGRPTSAGTSRGGLHGMGSADGFASSVPGSPAEEYIAGALGATGVMWPQMLGQRPRFAYAYAHNTRLQEIHSIYGQFIGPPRPAARQAPQYHGSANGGQRQTPPRMAGGYGTILVGDYFPMPSSPPAARQRPRSAFAAPTYRRAPERGGGARPESAVLAEAHRVANQPLLQ